MYSANRTTPVAGTNFSANVSAAAIRMRISIRFCFLFMASFSLSLSERMSRAGEAKAPAANHCANSRGALLRIWIR